MRIINFVAVFLIVYVIISIRDFLGIKFQWVQGTTVLDKFQAYAVEGLKWNFQVKSIVALILASLHFIAIKFSNRRLKRIEQNYFSR